MEEQKFELQEFIKNFDYYLSEKEYLEENSCNRILYFDTNEVINIIRGIWVFDNIKVFDKIGFFSLRTLVDAFVYDCAFETVNMLLPHLNELIKKLDQNHLFPENTKLHSNVEDFLNELFYSNPFLKLGTTPLKGDLEAYLESINVNAKTLFKVNYIFKEFFWRNRLAHLRKEDKILKIHTEKISFEEITRSEIFANLYNQLNIRRKNVLRNNFVDALSLTIFYFKLEAHKKNKKLPLPIFYCTSTTLMDVIQQLEKQNDKLLFSYKFKEKQISTIRREQFFIIKAIMLEETDYFKDFIHQSEQLKNAIKTELDNYIFTKAILQKDFKDQVEERIDKIIEFNFFEKIWYKKIGKQEILQAIINYINYNDDINNVLVKQWLKEQKTFIEQDIRCQLVDYRRKHEEWLKNEKNRILDLEFKVHDAFESIRKDLSDGKYKSDRTLDVIKEHALTRFSLRTIVCSRIKESYESILTYYEGGDNNEFTTTQTNLTNDIIYGMYDSDKTNFTVGIAILWIFRKYDVIISIFEKLNMQFDEYQLAVFHAASILRSSMRDDQKVLMIIEDIEEKKKGGLLNDNYKVDLSLSFLYFNFWYRLSESPSIPECMDKKYFNEMYSKTYYEYFTLAISLLSKTINYLANIKNDDPKKLNYRNSKYYYAINNFCYYTTLGGTYEEFSSLDFYIQKLKSCEREGLGWLNRFNDTLAHYYFRKAHNAETKSEICNYIELAEERNQKSIDGSRHTQRLYIILREEIKNFKIKNKCSIP